MCHCRLVSTSVTRRKFYFVFAVAIGISVGFMMTSVARFIGAGDALINTAGEAETTFVAHGCPLDGYWTEYERNRQQMVAAKSAQKSPREASVEEDVPKGQPGPLGPNEKVLEMMHNNDQRRHLLLVGVMTAQRYLDTRVMAVFHTWAQTLPGHVIFFTSANALTSPELPVVRLPTVDDTYPPQKKSFLMLKYISDHFLERYEWFMRADDDVYVRGDRLETFLRSINSTKPQFIGQAGMGNKEEFGQLNLDPDENFCMGGPGIVFSRATLRTMAPNIKHCLKNLYSTHEDVEVGRCVRTFAGIPCTWSYEMQTIFYHNSSGNEAFTGNLKQREIHRAITLHPVKQYHHFYRLHNYFLSLKMKDILQTNLALHRDIRTVMEQLKLAGKKEEEVDEAETRRNEVEGPVLSGSWETGKRPSFIKTRPKNDSEVLKWDFIHRVIYSYTHSNPRRRVDSVVAETLDEVVNQIMDLINRFSKQRGRVIDFKDILYAYQRVDPRHGADYILDMLLVYKKYRGRKMTLPVRKHVYVQRSFTDLQIRQDSTLDAQHNLQITDSVKSLLNEVESRYAETTFFVSEHSGTFSRALALETGSSRFQPSEQLLFMDVDILFDEHFLYRACTNTVRGSQVYFPIVFSQYDPFLSEMEAAEDAFVIDPKKGYWRVFGFGIVSMFRDDLEKVGGLDTNIQGWGQEDVDLYDKVIRSELKAFRACDPGLVHVFHPVECDEKLSSTQFTMCQGSKASSYASIDTLARLIYEKPDIIQNSHVGRLVDEEDAGVKKR